MKTVHLNDSLVSYAFYRQDWALPTVEIFQTGLMWTAADNGQDIDWDSAEAYCENLTQGYSDWRLPTIDELEALHDPGVDSHYKIRSNFTLTDCCPWSSTKEGSGRASHFDFTLGSPQHFPLEFSLGGRALCVRSQK